MPNVRIKSAPLAPPSDGGHVPPPSPDQMNPVGWTYSGPSTLNDPNAPLSDPWSQHVPAPPPDLLKSQPQVIVRPAGWFDDELTDDELKNDDFTSGQKNMFSQFLSDIGLDINPLYLALGGGGVLIVLISFCIAGMVRKFLAKKKLERIQNDKLMSGPSEFIIKSEINNESIIIYHYY